jgi:hypothetical protein
VSQTHSFPPAPPGDPIEWPGTPLGAANVITRTKSRTLIHDKAVDRVPGRRDDLVAAAEAQARPGRGRPPVWTHDVIIHGVRVRATTNSAHLHDFWVDNWFDPEEWRAVTGMTPPADPQVTVYAMGQVPEQQEAAYYSRRSNTIVFFNTAYYGQLKSWVLGAVGRVLAEEYGIHSVHGACVEKDGKGVLYIAPTGTGKSTSSYGLVGYPRTRFHSDDWVYVRYTYRTREGGRLHPLRVVTAEGEEVRGYRVFRWLEQQSNRMKGTVHGLDLENREAAVPLRDLDLDAPVEAYAYTSEKVYYLRTNLVENFPLSAREMLRSKMENVPDVAAGFLQANAALLDDLMEAIRGASGRDAAALATMDPAQLRLALARMIAFDNARAMLDLTNVLDAERVFVSPMEPARLAAVILLKRDRRDPTVLEHLSQARFIGRLLIGETPERKREIAYNAYRAVDDESEQAYITGLEQETQRRAGAAAGVEALAETFARRADVPETLAEEFELFRVMQRACRCYDLNTVLTEDSGVPDKKTAVEMTMRVIAQVVDTLPEGIRYTLQDYRDFIRVGKATRR